VLRTHAFGVPTLLHHGIYVGPPIDLPLTDALLAEARVVHVAGRPLHVAVREVPLEAFLRSDVALVPSRVAPTGGQVKFFVRIYKERLLSPADTVELARSRVGQAVNYNPTHNNCEHFAHECVNGSVATSKQIEWTHSSSASLLWRVPVSVSAAPLAVVNGQLQAMRRQVRDRRRRQQQVVPEPFGDALEIVLEVGSSSSASVMEDMRTSAWKEVRNLFVCDDTDSNDSYDSVGLVDLSLPLPEWLRSRIAEHGTLRADIQDCLVNDIVEVCTGTEVEPILVRRMVAVSSPCRLRLKMATTSSWRQGYCEADIAVFEEGSDTSLLRLAQRNLGRYGGVRQEIDVTTSCQVELKIWARHSLGLRTTCNVAIVIATVSAAGHHVSHRGRA